uniref:ArdC family protein n=1 Tax=uncultured Kiloniella sp. TaxID=1133091 RepID=UPI002610D7F5
MKKNFRDAVAEEIIEKLENGTAPWQKPWQADVPFNPTTNTPYKGMNSFWLEMAGYEDPRWMTYNQAKKSGAQVMKGSKSRSIEYWQWSTEHPILDENGKPIRDDEGKVQKQSVRLERPKVFHAALFNGSQIEGLEPYKAPALTFDPVAEADLILEGTNVSIVHDQKDRAFYHRNEDVIHLPDRTAFKSAYEYYATALHEVGHATGSPNRMIREKGPFGSDLYAKEELMVEMASYMMSRELGLGHYPDRHASYVDSWLNAIKEDKNYLFQAAQTSEKIRTWVMEPEKRMELERTTKLAHTHEREALEDNKSVVQGMDLTEEEKEIRLQKIIQQEEALIENFQPVFDGYDANPLSVHKPKLVDEITT